MILLLALFYYFYFSIIGIYIIFLPKIFSEVGYSAGEIGIIFAAAPLVRFILPFFFQSRFKLNSTVFNFSLLLIFASLLSFYFSLHFFYFLLLSNILFGVGLSLILPYVELISLYSIGKEYYGKVRLFGSLGFIVIALVLVRFLSSAYIALHFLFFLTAVMIVVAYFIQTISVKREQKECKSKEEGGVDLFRDYKLWLGLLLMQTSFGSFYNFFTIYETDRGISLDMTVYLWIFGVMAEIVMLYFQGKILSKNLLTLLQITFIIAIFRWFLLFLYPTNLILLFFAQSLHAFTFALFHSAAIAYLFVHYKNKTLAQQFFSGIAYGLGGLSGALIAGFVYEYYPKYLFLSSSFIAVSAFLMITFYKKEQASLA